MSESRTPALADLRVGQGFDVHPWSESPDRVLVLGGVRFDDAPGLEGHSDADVIAHAITDAILGAAGLGDIGTWFPDTAAEFKGSDSIGLLARASEEVHVAGWQVINADCTVILDHPKLAPHRDAMQANLAAALGAPVSVKGKRTEGVAGLAGGVQCHAVALCIRRDAR